MKSSGKMGSNISALKQASKAAYKAANKVKNFSVSNKHLQSAGGRWQKFATDSKGEVNAWIKEALESPHAQFLPNKEPNSYRVITNLSRSIGTKGETKIQVIIGEGGNIWTAYPVK